MRDAIPPSTPRGTPSATNLSTRSRRSPDPGGAAPAPHLTHPGTARCGLANRRLHAAHASVKSKVSSKTLGSTASKATSGGVKHEIQSKRCLNDYHLKVLNKYPKDYLRNS